MIMAMVVVLPAPLPPSSPVMLPRAMAKRDVVDGAGGLVDFYQMRDVDRRGPAGSAAGNGGVTGPLLTMRAVHWAIAAASARQPQEPRPSNQNIENNPMHSKEPVGLSGNLWSGPRRG